jgi:hypothetical protein
VPIINKGNTSNNFTKGFINRRFRHEFKFYINHFEYEILRRKLQRCLSRDKFSDKSGNYHIRSLYFEDANNTALSEKQAGVLSRKKYRIRIYNLENSIIKLEKKAKEGQFISKQSAQITLNEYNKIINNDIEFLRNSNDVLLQEFYYDKLSNCYTPVVVVDYIREAYVLGYSNIRITFDKELKTGLNRIDIFNDIPMIKAIEEPMMILEIKYDHFLPDFLRNILQIDSSQKYAISKYTICRKYTKMNSWEDM